MNIYYSLKHTYYELRDCCQPKAVYNEDLGDLPQYVEDLTSRMNYEKKVHLSWAEGSDITMRASFGFWKSGIIEVPWECKKFFLDTSKWTRVCATRASLAHELVHLKLHHVQKQILVQLLISAIVMIVFSATLCVIIAFAIDYFLTPRVLNYYIRYHEKQADLLACEVLTENELCAAVCYLERERIYNIKDYLSTEKKNKTKSVFNKFPQKCTEEGNIIADVEHYPLSERICYLRERIKTEKGKKYISEYFSYLKQI